jgi:hypothetical protein
MASEAKMIYIQRAMRADCFAATALTLFLTLHAHAQPAALESPASAATETVKVAASAGPKVDIKLGLLDGSASQGSTIALNYQAGFVKSLWNNEYTSEGSIIVDRERISAPVQSGILDLNARGTLTASRERNPNKLLDFSGTLSWQRLSNSTFTRLGGVMVYETDQGHQNSQRLVGLSALVTTSPGLISKGELLTTTLTYGDIKPDKDDVRKRTVGHLDSFRRWSAEVTYSTDISKMSRGEGLDLLQWRQLHLGYRHYQEENPASAIKAAGLDRNRLGYIRLILAGGAYIQYARGSLPFDLKSDRSVQIGFSQTLK